MAGLQYEAGVAMPDKRRAALQFVTAADPDVQVDESTAAFAKHAELGSKRTDFSSKVTRTLAAYWVQPWRFVEGVWSSMVRVVSAEEKVPE